MEYNIYRETWNTIYIEEPGLIQYLRGTWNTIYIEEPRI